MAPWFELGLALVWLGLPLVLVLVCNAGLASISEGVGLGQYLGGTLVWPWFGLGSAWFAIGFGACT